MLRDASDGRFGKAQFGDGLYFERQFRAGRALDRLSLFSGQNFRKPLTPLPQLIQETQGCSPEISDFVDDGDRGGVADFTPDQPLFFELPQAFSDHLLRCTADHPGEVVEAHRPILDVPEDGASPFPSDDPHPALDGAGLGAGIGRTPSAGSVYFDLCIHRFALR